MSLMSSGDQLNGGILNQRPLEEAQKCVSQLRESSANDQERVWFGSDDEGGDGSGGSA